VVGTDAVPPNLTLDSVTTPVDVTVFDVDLSYRVDADSTLIAVSIGEKTSFARRSGFNIDNNVNTVSEFVTAGTKAKESDVQKVFNRKFGGRSNV